MKSCIPQSLLRWRIFEEIVAIRPFNDDTFIVSATSLSKSRTCVAVFGTLDTLLLPDGKKVRVADMGLFKRKSNSNNTETTRVFVLVHLFFSVEFCHVLVCRAFFMFHESVVVLLVIFVFLCFMFYRVVSRVCHVFSCFFMLRPSCFVWRVACFVSPVFRELPVSSRLGASCFFMLCPSCFSCFVLRVLSPVSFFSFLFVTVCCFMVWSEGTLQDNEGRAAGTVHVHPSFH